MKRLTYYSRAARGGFWLLASMACDGARCDKGATWCIERAFNALFVGERGVA